MKKYYYLFGETITRCYFEDGLEGIIKLLEEFPVGHYDTAIFEFDPAIMSPTELLAAGDGWMGFAEITEQEYNKLKELGVEEPS